MTREALNTPEGEPTWWEEHGHKLMDLEFTFFEIQEFMNEVSQLLIDVMRSKKDNLSKTVVGLTSEKAILLNEFIRKFESKFGEGPLTLREIATALQAHVNEAGSGQASFNALDHFLELVIEFFSTKRSKLYDQVAVDSEYLNFWSDPKLGLPTNYLEISDEHENINGFLVDKIYAEIENRPTY